MKNLIMAFIEALKYMLGLMPNAQQPEHIKDWDLGPAIEIIKQFEGFRQNAYQDSAGVWTIGWGTTKYPDGSKVKAGDHITEADAEHFLTNWIKVNAVATIDHYVTVPLKYHQFIALVSFIYNVGPSAFIRSTMRRYINKGQMSLAADEFPKWRLAGGQVLKGLVRRRAKERDIFLNGLPRGDILH